MLANLMSILGVLIVITVILGFFSWYAHATCSPAYTSCDLTLDLGKAALYAIPVVWLGGAVAAIALFRSPGGGI